MTQTLTLCLCLGVLVPVVRSPLAQTRAAEKPDVRPAATSATALLPMTTTSSVAREHAAQGQRALDMGHPVDANEHFRAAVAADSAFAFGYLGIANSSNSLDEFRESLTRASSLAPKASRAEQLQIEIVEKSFNADLEGSLKLAQELVQTAPKNPRSYVALANVQTQLGKEADSRASLDRAIALAPNFVPAYLALGNSYLLNAPRDLAKAEATIRKAVDLEPTEYIVYDFLGDAYRATGKLTEARDAYTKAAELDPTNALELQQRGHVNAFLGNYDEARADYDSAMKIGKANEAANYGVYRALVSVYAGRPRDAIAELDRLAAAMDTMQIPDHDDPKIFALGQEILIATHTGAFDAAQSAIERRTAIQRAEGKRAGTEEFRRTQEADIAFQEGLLAARKGDYATATAKAKESMRAAAANRNPRKDEPAYLLLGIVALQQKHYDDALSYFAKANQNDIYVTYHRALALEGAGRTDEAKALFREVASYNFNTTGNALVRQDAIKRAG
jgi:tetratricopeptide (TPR) repeat protein